MRIVLMVLVVRLLPYDMSIRIRSGCIASSRLSEKNLIINSKRCGPKFTDCIVEKHVRQIIYLQLSCVCSCSRRCIRSKIQIRIANRCVFRHASHCSVQKKQPSKLQIKRKNSKPGLCYFGFKLTRPDVYPNSANKSDNLLIPIGFVRNRSTPF